MGPDSDKFSNGVEMTLINFLKLYAIALSTFLVIDFIWLRFVARSFYQSQLGHLMRPNVHWMAAVVFYLLFVVGIVILAVWPAIEQRSLTRALLLGALLGLVAYAAYDLTNLAILAGFPFVVALVDMVWGTFLCAAVSAITYSIARLFQNF
jgi:uncharacterized membrane protein